MRPMVGARCTSTYVQPISLLQNLPTATFTDDVLESTSERRGLFYACLLLPSSWFATTEVFPLFKKVYALNEELLRSRNAFDECIKQIVSDADSAAAVAGWQNAGKKAVQPKLLH